jgi:hypothetical protein
MSHLRRGWCAPDISNDLRPWGIGGGPDRSRVSRFWRHRNSTPQNRIFAAPDLALGRKELLFIVHSSPAPPAMTFC